MVCLVACSCSSSKETGKPSRVGGRTVPDEGLVTFEGLLDVERLSVSRALFGVVWSELCEELEDAAALGECGVFDWVPRDRVTRFGGDVPASPGWY